MITVFKSPTFKVLASRTALFVSKEFSKKEADHLSNYSRKLLWK